MQTMPMMAPNPRKIAMVAFTLAVPLTLLDAAIAAGGFNSGRSKSTEALLRAQEEGDGSPKIADETWLWRANHARRSIKSIEELQPHALERVIFGRAVELALYPKRDVKELDPEIPLRASKSRLAPIVANGSEPRATRYERSCTLNVSASTCPENSVRTTPTLACACQDSALPRMSLRRHSSSA